MQFNSLTYLIFLPFAFGLYWLTRSSKGQNVVLVAASMVFYGWCSTEFLMLMMATCVITYALSLYDEKWARTTAIILVFSVLGVFKYYDFFAENLQAALNGLGLAADLPTLRLVLPVGISFYTFQLAAYILDRRRDSFLDFITFITFFPQLVAGPIERAKDMVPQFTKRRVFDFALARDGMRLILWGLMKKMLIADNCATQVDYIFSNYATVSTPTLWLGALYFTFQIYGDFSGYSDIAIGSARLFGIKLSTNFRTPYFSKDIREFWGRWHITLMTWLRDYVYIPLGGNRRGRVRQNLNRLVVFSLSGLWHGANWTFIVWGVYHALWFLIPHRGLTFVIVALGWVIFRSPDLGTATDYFSGMFDFTNFGSLACSLMPVLLITLLVATEFFMRGKEHPFQWKDSGVMRLQTVRMTVYLILFVGTLWLCGADTQFIYFQF